MQAQEIFRTKLIHFSRVVLKSNWSPSHPWLLRLKDLRGAIRMNLAAVSASRLRRFKSFVSGGKGQISM